MACHVAGDAKATNVVAVDWPVPLPLLLSSHSLSYALRSRWGSAQFKPDVSVPNGGKLPCRQKV